MVFLAIEDAWKAAIAVWPNKAPRDRNAALAWRLEDSTERQVARDLREAEANAQKLTAESPLNPIN